MRFITFSFSIITIILTLTMLCQARHRYERPHIISLNSTNKAWGGGATHTMSLYKLFTKYGYPITLFVHEQSSAAHGFEQNNIPYTPIIHLKKILKELRKHEKKVVLLINSQKDKDLIKPFLNKKRFKTILFQHNCKVKQQKLLKKVDAVVCVNPDIAAEYQKMNLQEKLDIKEIIHLPPFLSLERFVKNPPRQSRKTFFKETFNIDLKPLPLIGVVANFTTNPLIKNHQLLFEALHILIHEKNKPVEVLLIGDGPTKQELIDQTKELKIQDYVHFLGSVMNIAPVLHYINFHVLPSTTEAFGIAHIDAGLMHKLSVGARGTGGELIIKDGVTGLLFENNNRDDLVQKLEFLLDHEELQVSMGNAAYYHVRSTFANNPHFKKLMQLITKLFKK